MFLTISITLFIFGTIIASFVGVVVARYGTGQSITTGRSRCDACNTQLTWTALVPLVSFFVSNGRAHCCDTRISSASTIAEISLGIVFILSYIVLGLSLALFFFLAAVAVLLALVEYDLMHQIIPPSFLGVFIILAVVTGFLISPTLSVYKESIFVGILIAVSFLLFNILSKGRLMGLADAPLAFGLSILVGPAAIPGVVFSFWIGALIGIGVLFQRPAGSRMGIEVPFAPFLAIGFLLAFLTQWNPFFIAGLTL